MSDLLCVISPHEKGFWQADVYKAGCDEEGVQPLWFATGKKGDDRYGVMNKASEAYPGIMFIAGVTGRCSDCSEEYFEMETHCECGSILSEP